MTATAESLGRPVAFRVEKAAGVPFELAGARA